MYQPTNYLQQLADYVKANLQKGYTLDALKFSLINQGYSRISVENAIELANQQLAEKVLPIKEKPQITYRAVSDLKQPVKKSFWKKIFG